MNNKQSLTACLKNGLLVAQATRLFRPATRRTERERQVEPMGTVFSRRCSVQFRSAGRPDSESGAGRPRHPFSKQALRLGMKAAVLALLHSTSVLFAADKIASTQIIDAYKLNAKTMLNLEASKEKQLQAAKSWKVFHDFQFTDQYEQSGIRFEHHVVDDAGKNWKPAHYDHGSAIAVADVDGDGKLDVYFVNQLGGNQLWRNLGRGKFENITASAGVGLEERVCVGASFADIDNDGLPDLYVTTVRMGNVLFKNLGGGKFKDITKESGLGYVGHSTTTVCWICSW